MDRCYKCGAWKEYDEFPSTMCSSCRAALQDKIARDTDPETFEKLAVRKLAQRLTKDDIAMLRGMLIRVDADMLEK